MMSSSSRVYVFGSGDCGQMGMGEDELSAERPVVIPYLADKHIVAIEAGGLHSLALSSTGEVFSWGCNDEKALGHGEQEFQVGRVLLPADARVVQLCAGDSISAVLTDDGRVFSWGTFRGVLGHSRHGPSGRFQVEPVQLDLHLPVRYIAAGANHLVALTADHLLFSWGSGEQGQLGRRILTRHKALGLRPANVTPRRGRNAVPIAAVACGSYHTLALAVDGSVFAMGLNNYGQLGLGDREDRSVADEAIPQEAFLGHRIAQLAAGEHHSIALSSSGAVFAFGRNDSGQLGIPHITDRLSAFPQANPTLSAGITAIAAGANHSLAVHGSTNTVLSWGYGEMAQLGHGREQDEPAPRPIQFDWYGRVAGVAAGGQHSLVLSSQ